ncbi:MAG: hypothetical protein SGILL_009897, partial [Bacillariaceae sp.]
MSPPRHPKILVICDLQQVALNSLPEAPQRRALVDFIRMVVHVARICEYKIVWSGLCFSSDYCEIEDSHKVFGALKRIHRLTNGKSGNKFFVKGEAATDFVLEVNEEAGDIVMWRSGLMPPPKEEWASMCPPHSDNVDSNSKHPPPEVTVVGIRTGYSVQATVQAL